jgi:hypothetical protein
VAEQRKPAEQQAAEGDQKAPSREPVTVGASTTSAPPAFDDELDVPDFLK